PNRPPVIRRRFHHHFAHLIVLEPGDQMEDLILRRSKLPLNVFHLLLRRLPDHYRQHLLMHVNSSYATIYRFHIGLLVIVSRQRTGSGKSVTLTGSPGKTMRQDPHLSIRTTAPGQTLSRSRHIQCPKRPRLPAKRSESIFITIHMRDASPYRRRPATSTLSKNRFTDTRLRHRNGCYAAGADHTKRWSTLRRTKSLFIPIHMRDASRSGGGPQY